MKHYVYRHIRLDKNVPFYVGVGTSSTKSKTFKTSFFRAFDFKKRNQAWKRVYNKTEIRVEIIYESDDYQEVLAKEIEFIKLYGSIIDSKDNPLVNLTYGGQGQVGFKHSQESKNKMSKTRKSKTYPVSPEERKARSIRFSKENNPRFGKTQPAPNTCKTVTHIETGIEYVSLADACRRLNLNYKIEHQRITRNSLNKTFNQSKNKK
jgi:hypothetical protein